MNLAVLSTSELIGTVLGFVFTLMVFSYIFGDNTIFRVAMYIFIGVTAGYATAVAFYNVIWPQMLIPIIYGSQSEQLFVLFPLIFSGLLLLKIAPRFSRLGNVSMAFIVGVGVATMIGGAVLGTIFPQVQASVNAFELDASMSGGDVFLRFVNGGVILLGTLTTLIYFHFGVRSGGDATSERPTWFKSLAWVGQVFIAITFGALFAGVYTAALTALIERLNFIGEFLFPFFGS